MGKGNGHMVGGRDHCIMVLSYDFILGTTAALLEDIRFTLERLLRYIVGGSKYNNNNKNNDGCSA